MTIDKRLEKLVERHEALTESVVAAQYVVEKWRGNSLPSGRGSVRC